MAKNDTFAEFVLLDGDDFAARQDSDTETLRKIIRQAITNFVIFAGEETLGGFQDDDLNA